MTTLTRFGLSLTAATLSLGLAFGSAAVAQGMKNDAMGKPADAMKNDAMTKPSNMSDPMKKDTMAKPDAMAKPGTMSDPMKKDSMSK